MGSRYFGNFSSWEDVQREFDINTPEPDQVLYAEYAPDDREGYACVIFKRGDKYYEAHGSHCSCHGLEGQWEPRKIPEKIFDEYMEKLGKHGTLLGYY